MTTASWKRWIASWFVAIAKLFYVSWGCQRRLTQTYKRWMVMALFDVNKGSIPVFGERYSQLNPDSKP
jgi:hypothetical protein